MGHPAVGLEKRIPFGNDREKGKSNGKGVVAYQFRDASRELRVQQIPSLRCGMTKKKAAGYLAALRTLVMAAS
jgi:hypothetical protein